MSLALCVALFTVVLSSRLANRQCTITGAFGAPKRRLLVVLLFGSATASQSRLQVRTPFSHSAPPPMPSSLKPLHLRSWRVEGASPPPIRAPPPSGKLPDLGKALVVAAPMHVARRLATINVSPSDNLQTKLNNAGAGDTLILADGTYLGSGSNVLEISKDITIRAQNSGQAILDGENTRSVIDITNGTVTLEGLNITRGYKSVRWPFPHALQTCLVAHSLHRPIEVTTLIVSRLNDTILTLGLLYREYVLVAPQTPPRPTPLPPRWGARSY